MVLFLSGALTFGFFIAALYFFKFWKKTWDALFLHMAIAFLLFALNQGIAAWISPLNENYGYTYLLRVIGFIAIMIAIIRKNISSPANRI